EREDALAERRVEGPRVRRRALRPQHERGVREAAERARLRLEVELDALGRVAVPAEVLLDVRLDDADRERLRFPRDAATAGRGREERPEGGAEEPREARVARLTRERDEERRVQRRHEAGREDDAAERRAPEERRDVRERIRQEIPGKASKHEDV